MANVDAFKSGFSMGQKKAKGGDDNDQSNGHIGKDIKSFKNGGKVKKTGIYRLHAGEEVIPSKRAKKREKSKSYKKVSAKR